MIRLWIYCPLFPHNVFLFICATLNVKEHPEALPHSPMNKDHLEEEQRSNMVKYRASPLIWYCNKIYIWHTLIVMISFWWGVCLFMWSCGQILRWCGKCVLGLDQHGRLPFDRVPQVHGQTLILLLIVTDEVVQILKKHLLQTSRRLKK